MFAIDGYHVPEDDLAWIGWGRSDPGGYQVFVEHNESFELIVDINSQGMLVGFEIIGASNALAPDILDQLHVRKPSPGVAEPG